MADTKEHVVPSCLYPEEPKVKLLTVPACWDCNNALAKDEEYFHTVLIDRDAWTNSPIAREVWEKRVRPSFKREEWQGLRKLLASNVTPIYLPSPTGFTEIGILTVDRARLERVAEKIVRGLYYHLTRRIIPQTTKMSFYWRPKDWAEDIALQASLINVDPDVFSCRYGIASGESPEGSIWWMLFYRSIMYIVTAEGPVIHNR